MISTGPRALASAAVLAAAVFATACAAPEDVPVKTAQRTTAQDEVTTTTTEQSETPSEPARTRDEQAFLDDLTQRGVPTDSAADTTVEVGIGICRGLSDGTNPDEILNHIRPLTSALAAQTGDRDTGEVGRALVDASRAHLCA